MSSMKKIYRFSVPCFVALYSCLLTGQVAVPTYQYDNNRSGTNTNETILTPSNVNVSQFGRLNNFSVQGEVYAQPLYLPNMTIGGTSHNVLFVATEHDQVYAFDVNSGQQLWHTNFLAGSGLQQIVSTVSSTDVDCTDITPEIGITGTPVIDTTTSTLYVSVETKQFNPQTQVKTFYQKLHALDITTGLDKVPPHNITALVRGTGGGSIGGTIAFNALLQNQRPSLLLADGQVFVSWGSHCDIGNFHGWLMSFNEASLTASGVYIDTPNEHQGGFWGSGSGPAVDAAGSIYSATGNGWFDINTGGIDYGDSVLRLTWSGSGIAVADYFTPWDQLTLDDGNTDVSSGGLVLLPDQTGSQYPHLLVQVGKEGTIDLINRDNMGHYNSSGDTQIVQTLPFIIGGVFGGPAFWNNNAYFGGLHDYLKAFSFNPQTELLSTAPTSQSPEQFNFPGPTPAVSSNGASNGIVWIIETDNYRNGGNAVLRAYNANNLSSELYNSQQNSGRDQAGLAVKFAVPTVADGHVFVGAQNQVAMYGLLQQRGAALELSRREDR
jgi:hypothetical protein